MNAVRFSALRHAVKIKHEIELLQLEMAEFMSSSLPDDIKKGMLLVKSKELNERKMNLMKYCENNELEKIIFENYKIK